MHFKHILIILWILCSCICYVCCEQCGHLPAVFW